MRIKNFTQFISEGDWFDNHPDHPANQEDIESTRDVEFKPSEIEFDLLATDYQSVAIVQNKDSKFYYAVNLESDDIKEYQLKYEVDEETEYEDIDDDAILFMVQDLTSLSGTKVDAFLGEGVTGWEDGKIVVLMDESLREYLEEDYARISRTQWVQKLKPAEKKNYENLHKTIVEIKEPLHNMRGKMAGKKYGF
jgi:hypothetical protein